MPYRRNYPRTVAEVLDDRKRFRPAALRAVKAYRAAKPWRGTIEERRAKLLALNADLARAYRLPAPAVRFAPKSGASSFYRPSANAITICGALSVVTYLHEFGHARGFDERQTCGWSINLFRRVFPRSYARLRHEGHMLVR